MKKSKFKKLVKSAVEDVAFKELKAEVKTKNLKKMKNLSYTKIEIQKYFMSELMTTAQKKIIFSARTGMLPVGFNFGQKITCFACEMSEDTDRHLLECVVLKMACPDLMENTKSIFEDVFDTDMLKVSNVSKLLKSALRAREIIKNN